MKQTAPLLLLLTLTISPALASPPVAIDEGMVIRPDQLMHLAAGRPKLIRVDATDPAVTPAPVPEPCSAVLLPLGSALVVWSRQRRPTRAPGT